MSKSSQKAPRQILGVISAKRAEQMLREWVNTDLTPWPEDAKAFERLFRNYPEIMSADTNNVLRPVGEAWDRFHQQMEMADSVAAILREAWDASDLRRFEWYTWKAQTEYEWEALQAKHNVTPTHVMDTSDNLVKVTNALLEADEPPAVITPVEAAIFYLRHNRDRALHCPNPECPAPYFFRSKKSQKYCSLECAKPAQRDSKKRWWADNRAKRSDL
jgi:hypothetical protein